MIKFKILTKIMSQINKSNLIMNHKKVIYKKHKIKNLMMKSILIMISKINKITKKMKILVL